MFTPRFTRAIRPRSSSAVLALALVLSGAGVAGAQEIHTTPGSACQASGSTQDLYYSGVSVANRTNSTASAVCPIVRRNPTDGWWGITVVVRDRHSTLNISCTAQARDVYGAAGSGWSDTQSSSGEGEQVLNFSPPAGTAPDYGPYVVVCAIPAMEEVNQPSYISSIIVGEP